MESYAPTLGEFVRGEDSALDGFLFQWWRDIRHFYLTCRKLKTFEKSGQLNFPVSRSPFIVSLRKHSTLKGIFLILSHIW